MTDRVSPYLTPPEAASYVRATSLNAFWLWVNRHHVPKCYRGRRVLFRISDLDRQLEDPQGAIVAFARAKQRRSA